MHSWLQRKMAVSHLRLLAKCSKLLREINGECDGDGDGDDDGNLTD
jgi:hypothetical protein